MNLLKSISDVNLLAVIVVTILSFPLGFLWHSKFLFLNAWKKENKMTDELPEKVNFAKVFGLTAVFHFIAMLFLATFIGRHSTYLEGFVSGFIISIAWVTTSFGAKYLFVNRSMKLLLIDAGFYVVLYSIAGLILGAW